MSFYEKRNCIILLSSKLFVWEISCCGFCSLAERQKSGRFSISTFFLYVSELSNKKDLDTLRLYRLNHDLHSLVFAFNVIAFTSLCMNSNTTSSCIQVYSQIFKAKVEIAPHKSLDKFSFFSTRSELNKAVPRSKQKKFLKCLYCPLQLQYCTAQNSHLYLDIIYF